MNNKDKDINNLLIGYAESNKPDIKITEAAKIKLSEKRHKPRVFNYYKLARNAAVFVCVFFAIVFCFHLIPNRIKESNGASPDSSQVVTIKTYYPEDIYVKSASKESVIQYAPWVDNVNSTCEVYQYCSKENDSVLMYYITAKIAVDNGYSELKLYVEITKDVYSKLEDMQSYNYNEYDNYNGIDIKNTTVYIDGEYMSSAYYIKNDVKYYLDSMSSLRSGLNDLLNILTD